MKKLSLLIAILISTICVHAQNSYYTRLAGSWSDNTSVWSTTSQNGAACSCTPGNSLAGSNTVYIYNSVTSFGALSSLSGSGKLIIESNDSAIITTSNLGISGSASITVNSGGVLILNGSLTMAGSSSITINSGGSVYVYGSVTNSGSAAVTDNGSFTVHGNVTTSGSASFTGTGKSYVIGTVSGPNTSILSVLPDFFSSFTNAAGTGLVSYQTSPVLSFQPLQFNNNASTVLTGNGTFASFSSLNPWQVSGTKLYYNAGNVGIGTASPNYPLTVQGNALINGTLFANNVSASNGLSIGNFRIVNGVVDTINSATGTIMLNAVNVNASNGLTAAILNAGAVNTGTINSLSGNVGFGSNNITTTGTLSAGNFNVNKLTVADTEVVPAIKTHRIALFPGDSLIRFGDSSIVMNMNTNNIYGEITQLNIFTPPAYDGIGIGSNNSVNTNVPSSQTTAVAIGAGNKICPSCFNTLAAGYYNNINAVGAITIGSGLTNAAANSIMFGIGGPTLVVTNNQVGIGTISPQAFLDVEGATSNIPGLIVGSPSVDYAYGIVDYVDAVNHQNIKAFAVVNKSNGMDMMDIYSSGEVRATEVKVCISGCDFVFDRDYDLMPIGKLEDYLKLNHHLPGIASAKEMEEGDGIELGKMNSKLLQKVEELTLYIIQQQKDIKELQTKFEQLSKK